MDLPQSTPASAHHRTCPTCGTSYPRTPDFWWRDRSKDQGLDGVCKVCRNAATRHLRQHARQRDPISARAADVAKRRNLRLLVLTHYSGGSPCCACCGESHLEFLAIDHVNGRGRAERGKLGRYGDSLYKWLRKEGYPDRFRVLCHNCNGSLGFYGYCPHSRT